VYFKPPGHIKAKHWSSQAEPITGLTHHCDKIKNAQSIVDVWTKFINWCESIVPAGKIGCIGTERPVLEYGFGTIVRKHIQQLEYCMDPMSVIKKYSGCKLHMKHSGISGVSLESVYCHIT
jgi:hypothetical protein